MIWRAVFVFGCIVALLTDALAGLVVYLCTIAASLILMTALHRGYYRSNR